MTDEHYSELLTQAIQRAESSRSHLELPKASGVYIILNTVNGRVYVGQSGNIRTRRSQHLTLLRCGGECANRYMLADFQVHGQDAFRFAVAQLCEDTATLNAIERSLIAVAKRHGSYNIDLGLPDSVQTASERQQAMRQRRADAGLVRLELWAHPDDHAYIKEFAAALQRRRERENLPTDLGKSTI